MSTTGTCLGLASLAVSVGASVWAYISSTKLERLKAELTQKIESQKVNWALNAKLSEIRFSRLHEKQFEACQKLYSLLVLVQQEFWDIYKRFKTGRERTDTEKIKALESAISELQDFLRENGVLFPQPLTDKIEALNKEIIGALIGVDFQKIDWKIFFDSGDKYFKNYSPILVEIRELVQNLIGVGSLR